MTFRHFVCTGFGISKESYGEQYKKLIRTRQSNMVSGAICRDQSCLVFRKLESLKKGLEIVLPLFLKRVQQT